jgi:hypothetical protein
MKIMGYYSLTPKEKISSQDLVRVEVEIEVRVYDLKERTILTEERNCFVQTD